MRFSTLLRIPVQSCAFLYTPVDSCTLLCTPVQSCAFLYTPVHSSLSFPWSRFGILQIPWFCEILSEIRVGRESYLRCMRVVRTLCMTRATKLRYLHYMERHGARLWHTCYITPVHTFTRPAIRADPWHRLTRPLRSVATARNWLSFMYAPTGTPQLLPCSQPKRKDRLPAPTSGPGISSTPKCTQCLSSMVLRYGRFLAVDMRLACPDLESNACGAITR